MTQGASSSEEGNESADQDESEDDDVRWYKEEVGEDPDEGRTENVFVPETILTETI